MPKAYILIGVPGSGKSTWIHRQPFDWTHTAIISTDNYVEKFAKSVNATYNDVFEDYMPTAVERMVSDVKDAFAKNMDIVWDQTSTTVATRAKKIRMIPKTYEIIAVVFPTPDDTELNRRLASRPGKTIPHSVMHRMKSHWEEPSEKEGFNKIIYIKGAA